MRICIYGLWGRLYSIPMPNQIRSMFSARSTGMKKLITVVPITDASGKEKNPAFIKIQDLGRAGLNKDSVIDPNQIRTLSIERIQKKMGVIGDSELFEIRRLLALILQIDEEHLR